MADIRLANEYSIERGLGIELSTPMPTLFDPLQYLQHELHTLPALEAGEVVIRFDGPVSADQRKKAFSVARVYEKLRRLQLENGGVSVRKLLACEKIKVVGGRCVAGFHKTPLLSALHPEKRPGLPPGCAPPAI